jgi:ABC-type transport system involved in multi-copper enzyme maturation permease subunit
MSGVIGLVAWREFKDHVLSGRFYGALVFFSLLLGTGTWILGQDQAVEGQALAPFLDSARYRQAAEGSNVARLTGGGVFVARPLPPFRGLVRGLDDLSLVAQVKGGNYILYLRQPFVGNSAAAFFADFDLVFAVGVLASLLALVFTYDAFAGERERGTLRLLLVQGAGRAQLLAGKFCGAMLALSLVVAPSLVLALWIGGAAVSGAALSGEWVRVVVSIGAASLLYGAVFVSLGLGVSALCAQARTALVAALGLWSVLVWVLPGAGALLASRLVGAPAWLAVEANINQVRWQAEVDGWEEVSDYISQRGWAEKEEAQWNLDWGSWSDGVPRLQGVLAEAEWRDLNAYSSGVMRRQLKQMEERAGQLKADFSLRRQREIDWGRALARLSPFGAYTFLATDLAYAGIGAEMHFRHRVERFKGELSTYLEQQLASRGFWDELDAGQLPYFVYQPEAAPQAGLPEIVLLLVYGLLGFLGAQAALNRAPV